MGFKYVFVPASPNEPIQELTFDVDIDDLQNDSFRPMVEQFFNKLGQSVDREVLLEQLKTRTGIDIAEKAASGEMSGLALDALLSASSVEIFPVLLPTKASDFQGISVYVDDKGVAKELEENPRMSHMIQAANYPGQTFRGDCFIGRVIDDGEDVWKRVDFTLADCSSDAAWVEVTKRQRSNRNVGDMASMAGKIGANSPVQINPSTMPDATPKGETETYQWSQNAEEVEVTFKQEGVGKSDKKHVKVHFSRQKLKVVLKGEILIDGGLGGLVDPDECTWTLSDGTVQVTLMKASEDSWNSLLKA